MQEAELVSDGHQKIGKNLWKKDDSYLYLREGKLVDARGISGEDAKLYGVELAKIPKEAQPKPMASGLEKFQAKTATLNELKGEEYLAARELAESIDTRLIEMELAGEVVDKFVYSFPSAGRTVQGLTWPGVRFIAKRVGKIEMESLDVIDYPESWVVKVRAVDRKSGVAMFGLAQQAKAMKLKDGKTQPDQFALEKCSSRAMRNAMRALIPEQESIALLNQWLKQAKV